MKKSFRITISAVLLLTLISFVSCREEVVIKKIPGINNSNHPQIAYWFLTPEILVNDKYLADLDKMIDQTPFDFIFLDARDGCSFDNLEVMHPVMEKIVARAHQRNIKIGYRAQVKRDKQEREECTESFIAEAETTLDHSGNGSCSLNAEFVRSSGSYKQEVFKVYLFKKSAAGFYEPASCRQTTDYTYSVKDQTVKVNIKAGNELKGYTAYVLARFYYSKLSNHSAEAAEGVIRFINTYADIPFDGVMLDEYGNAQVLPPWKMMFKLGNYRLRSYSPPMAKELESRTGLPDCQVLLDMRYAPAGKPEVRIKAINTYMDLMREGAMHVENAMYKHAKVVYGPDCFIAAHNTFHNSLVNDEIWATGLKWWTIPREYGFTDELTPLPTQMGIAMSYPAKAMYNMYYDSNIGDFTTKTLTDLRYGIRTFYHAFNDKQWGIGLETPVAINAINPVENCARLMNRFNPSLPEIKLLVIFGNEALQNWYPNKSERGSYDINDQLEIEDKALKVWNAGYLNALVPTDLISCGKLKLDSAGKPVLSGHKFDAVIFLYPEYSKESTLQFLEEYVGKGGKLMMEGTASYDFNGNNITGRMKNILDKAVEKEFSADHLPELGLTRNAVVGGCKNEDGSYVFTDISSLRKKRTKIFKLSLGQDVYSGDYSGFAAISADSLHGLQKMACAGFNELKKNGVTILKLEHSGDIFIEKQNNIYQVTIAGEKGTNHIVTNKLN